MARKRLRRSRHELSWAWHEERLAEPHLSYHGATQSQWERWLEGKRQQMAMHDTQPERLRELVREHNVTKAQEIMRQEILARPRCPHGRQADICAVCLWAKHQDEQRQLARDGSELTRQAGGGRSARFRDV